MKAAGAISGMIPCPTNVRNTSMSSIFIAIQKPPFQDPKSQANLITDAKTRFSPNANLLAGGFGGLCSLVVGYPFDTVKVRLQTSSQYHSAMHCFKSIIIKEGPMSLFRGVSGLALVALPRFALMFHSNTVARNLFFKSDESSHNYVHICLSGALSQILVVPLIVAPLERIKVILQTDTKINGQVACLKHIIAQEGVQGVFKGTLVTFARDMPSFSTYFLVYEMLRYKFFTDTNGVTSTSGTLISGALAGIAGWAVAIPADVIKNRHQACSQSKSAFQNAVSLFRSQGLKGFYLGAGPILLRAGPANAAAFLGYELSLKAISYTRL